MKKVLYIDTESQKNKYVLKKEYGDFGIYQSMTPSGYLVHKSWAITNGDKILIINSFNNRCLYEILSPIDMCIRAFNRAMPSIDNPFKDFDDGNPKRFYGLQCKSHRGHACKTHG